MSFGRDHTWPMNDYASTHGFSLIDAGGRDPRTLTYLPAGTTLTGGFGLSRRGMVKSLGVEPERLDKLVDLGEEAMITGLVQAGTFKRYERASVVSVDAGQARARRGSEQLRGRRRPQPDLHRRLPGTELPGARGVKRAPNGGQASRLSRGRFGLAPSPARGGGRG